MAHTFWRGEHIVLQRDDGTADIYEWHPASGSYKWLGDYASADEAEHYVREMEALPEFPEIKPINASVGNLSGQVASCVGQVAPSLQSIFDRVWTKQQLKESVMSLDHYLTTEPDTSEEWAACDNCGVHKPFHQMRTIFTPGCETWACDECCGIEEEEDGPLLTQAELQERTREMLAPCTDLARRQGCTCFMADVYASDIEPPEPVINHNCPLHGHPPDEDHYRERQRLRP